MKNKVSRKSLDKNGNIHYHNPNGDRHRLDGPAIIWSCGDKEWWVNGKLHREGGPAVEYHSGAKEWWINGKLHREDGPALIWDHSIKEWWFYGKKHRIFGPSFVDEGGSEYTEWNINDENYSKTEHNRLVLFFILEPRKITLIPVKE